MSASHLHGLQGMQQTPALNNDILTFEAIEDFVLQKKMYGMRERYKITFFEKYTFF